MKNLAKILSILVLTACAAQGPAYTGNEKGNVVIYRASAMAGALSPYHVQIGNKKCALKNGGFYSITLKKKDVLVAGWVDGAISSSIEINPGDYIRVEHNVGNSLIQGVGMEFGAIGGAIGAQTSGDFLLSKIPASIAKTELVGLNQDCTQ